MYYKGANILHTVRQLIHNDNKWRSILTGLNKEFYHQTVSSKQVEEYISKQSVIDLSVFWDQYLRTVQIPKVEYKIDGNSLNFRYINILENFEMPIIAIINGKEEWISPISEWKTKEFSEPIKTIKIKEDFYIETKNLSE